MASTGQRYASLPHEVFPGGALHGAFFDLALPRPRGDGGRGPAGYVGLITANSFMKREFGKKLIEALPARVGPDPRHRHLRRLHPGPRHPHRHFFGRNRPPVGDTVRAVMGIKGEPASRRTRPRGWCGRAIVDQVDRAGSEGEFVTVADVPRATFAKHPWSIGGGGAADLKAEIEEDRRGWRLRTWSVRRHHALPGRTKPSVRTRRLFRGWVSAEYTMRPSSSATKYGTGRQPSGRCRLPL